MYAMEPGMSATVMHTMKGFIHRSDYTPAKCVLWDWWLGDWDRAAFWTRVLKIMGAHVLASDAACVSWTHGPQHYCFFLKDGLWSIKNGFDIPSF